MVSEPYLITKAKGHDSDEKSKERLKFPQAYK